MTLQDEHVETLDLRRRARPGGDPGLHHLGLPRLRAGRPLPPTRRVRLPGRPARHLAARRGRPPRRHHLPRPRRGHLARSSWPTTAPATRRTRYQSTVADARRGCRRIRRDLIKRHLYLVPNSIVVSRGCPHACDFCYKDAFFEGGKSFYTQTVDDALAEIDRLPGRHLYFLDDHLFGNRSFAAALFDGMRGHGPAVAGGRHRQVGPAARPAREGRRLRPAQPVRRLRDAQPGQPPASTTSTRTSTATTRAAIRRLHDLGVMVNGSFVFGMDDDDPTVFDRTVDWAIGQGIETATFHILTPYPGTGLHARMAAAGPHHHRGLGPLRHPPRRVPAGPADPGRARGRLLAGLPRLLPLGLDRPGRRAPRRAGRTGCATSPTPAAGRSSSRCGTWSSARSR